MIDDVRIYNKALTEEEIGDIFDDVLTITARTDGICPGDTLTLFATPGFNDYKWDTGETTDRIVIDQPGTYHCTAYNPHDSLYSSNFYHVVQLPAPTFSLTSSGDPCRDESITLCANFSDPEYSVVWSTGETSRCIEARESGEYTCFVTNKYGCESRETIVVNKSAQPEITASDTAICEGQSVMLRVEGDYESYEWSTGETTNNITVTQPGTYVVEVVDKNGCRGSAEIVVHTKNLPAPQISASTENPCSGETVTLSAPEGYAEYHWSTGESTRQISVGQSGEYWVEVVDASGCRGVSEVKRVEFMSGAPVELVSAMPDSAYKTTPLGMICHLLEFRNTSQEDVTLTNSNLYLRENYYFTIPPGQLPRLVRAGGTAQIRICFSPDSVRRFTDVLSLFDDGGCGEELELTGWGVLGDEFMRSRCGMDLIGTVFDSEVYPRIGVAPNPSGGSFDIDISNVPAGMAMQLELVNQYGERIIEKNNIAANETIDTGDAGSGIYFIIIRSAEFTLTKKVMIIK